MSQKFFDHEFIDYSAVTVLYVLTKTVYPQRWCKCIAITKMQE